MILDTHTYTGKNLHDSVIKWYYSSEERWITYKIFLMREEFLILNQCAMDSWGDIGEIRIEQITKFLQEDL